MGDKTTRHEQIVAELTAAADARLCECRDRPADKCPGRWEPGCDLGCREETARWHPGDEAVELALAAVRDASDARLPRYKVVQAALTAAWPKLAERSLERDAAVEKVAALEDERDDYRNACEQSAGDLRARDARITELEAELQRLRKDRDAQRAALLRVCWVYIASDDDPLSKQDAQAQWAADRYVADAMAVMQQEPQT
jgi:septal ring factor EnvC (AmiA/AmiB activator)